MRNLILLFICFLAYYYSYSQTISILPQPVKIQTLSNKNFEPDSVLRIFHVDEELKNEADFLLTSLKNLSDLTVTNITPELLHKNHVPFVIPDHSITLKLLKSVPENQYELLIQPKSMVLTGGSPRAIFYGIQSILQLFSKNQFPQIKIPSAKIIDYPRFDWRGMHLDVCRHFFPKEFIKKYIDLLALHKMNVFHWHLTEDQGWRIEIKKYPKLTSVGAWRQGSMVGHYNEQRYDSIQHGGFYTQEDIKEIVKYAQLRHITIVPEIEMPGHSVAAIASYPELSCTQKPLLVEKKWGVFDDVYCAGNENTFTFLQHVLDEVCELFPGKYIHIGGDECPKERWKNCEKCQKRIQENNLKDEHELQSYFIQRMEKYLNAKGKQIIGWDEILEGGLAPNAAVMSWRGTDGGIAAAKQNHYVVMSPGSHCYFDHYQGNPRNEPVAIGGFTTVQKVYSYEPIPDNLSSAEAKYIMGAQGNVWTEYITNEKQAEYMAVPRMCALAEVLWTPKEKKNETDFIKRLISHFSLLDKFNINYSSSLFDVEFVLQNSPTGMALTFDYLKKYGKINYTIRKQNSEAPYVYSEYKGESLTLSSDCVVDAFLYDSISGKMLGKHNTQSFYITKSTGKKISFKIPPSDSYKGNPLTLVDGTIAHLPRIRNEWQAWSGQDVEMTIDLEKQSIADTVVVNFLKDENNWIYAPAEIEILYSVKGKRFKVLAKANQQTIQKNNRFLRFTFPTKKMRYLKIKAKNPGKIPNGKPGQGSESWLFFDEISVY